MKMGIKSGLKPKITPSGCPIMISFFRLWSKMVLSVKPSPGQGKEEGALAARSMTASQVGKLEDHKGDEIPNLKGKGPFNFPGQNRQRAFEQS